MSENKLIREVPISEDALQITGAEVMAHPPKFPLLKGSEEEQILFLLINLTDSGVISWFKLFINQTAWFYAADYQGIRFHVSDFFNSGISSLNITPLDVFSQYTRNGKSFVSNKVEKLKIAIEKQNPPKEDFIQYGIKRRSNKTLLARVLDVLNS